MNELLEFISEEMMKKIEKKNRPKKSVHIWHMIPAMLGASYEEERINVKCSPYWQPILHSIHLLSHSINFCSLKLYGMGLWTHGKLKTLLRGTYVSVKMLKVLKFYL